MQAWGQGGRGGEQGWVPPAQVQEEGHVQEQEEGWV